MKYEDSLEQPTANSLNTLYTEIGLLHKYLVEGNMEKFVSILDKVVQISIDRKE